MKFLVVIVGLFAISNAAVVLRTAAPAPLILGNAVVPAIAPIVKALPAVPATELSEWSAYKEKFSKVYYSSIEDRLRRNIYFANKEKIAKIDELYSLGLAPEKLELNIFADQTRDEIFSLRSIVDEDQNEWIAYKSTYGKVYDDIEDQFHKTTYFIIKEAIEAHNKLADFGYSTFKLAINAFTDFFGDELLLRANLLGSADHIPLAVPVVRTISSLELPAFATYPSLPFAQSYPGGAILKYTYAK